jgi:DR2241 stabilising domain/4Fe-4S iron-sulfur cluster binding domain
LHSEKLRFDLRPVHATLQFVTVPLTDPTVYPPLELFMATLGAGRVWGEVCVTVVNGGFDLRHQGDRDVADPGLRAVTVPELRTLAQFKSDGTFRPLKSAPTLVSGWRCLASTPGDLASAINHLYPGSLADWWTTQTQSAAPTGYRDVAARQTGKGRILQDLKGPALAAVVSVTCAPSACLKHRLWHALDVATDRGAGKSAIPCLEPCPLFLSFARTSARIELSPALSEPFAPDDLSTIEAALRHTLSHPPVGLRDGEVFSPLHPKRVARVLERHADAWAKAATPEPELHHEEA